ncbi:MAG: N-acetylglucosamine-6-phosphate deacetylase [Oscillospiraceae bacterium]|nr:N-acetylglucosamine-6-phosphate deacetylase [Oscillospiraceae bacterium]
MRLINGKIFEAADGFSSRSLCIRADKIIPDAEGDVFDVSGCYVVPGLSDLHFHGARGADFSDGDAEGLCTIAEYALSRGVTQICPAGMTLPPEQLRRICRMAKDYRDEARTGAELVGVNLEGPFLSGAKKGAQNGAWLREPDIALFRELCGLSGGLVKRVTVAPELPGAMAFIREASCTATVSIGHTAADYDTAREAFAAGARGVTHLFNAMPPLAHREPGVVGAAADSENVYAELISDGVHVHPSMVRAAFKLFGRDRIILISDTMRAAGMADGKYTLGGQTVRVGGKRATLEDGTIAGSVTDLMACMVTAVSFGIPLHDAVTAAAVNPAKALGIYERCGSLDAGKAANIAVLDGELRLKAVLFRGKLISGAL